MRKSVWFLFIIWGLLSICIVISCNCKRCVDEDEVLYPKRKPSSLRGLYVYTDNFGNQRIPNPETSKKDEGFYDARAFNCDLALVIDMNGKWKYINRQGETTIDASNYDLCLSFEEFFGDHLGFRELAIVNKGADSIRSGMGWFDGGKYGLINKTGELVLPVEYDEFMTNIESTDRSRWRMKKDGLYGFLNERGEVVISLQYEDAGLFYEGCVPAKKGGKWGLIDEKGIELLPFKYDRLCHIGMDSIWVYEKKDSFLINTKGKKL